MPLTPNLQKQAAGCIWPAGCGSPGLAFTARMTGHLLPPAPVRGTRASCRPLPLTEWWKHRDPLGEGQRQVGHLHAHQPTGGRGKCDVYVRWPLKCSPAATPVDPEDSLLSEISWSQKNKSCVIPLIWGISRGRTLIEAESNSGCRGAGGSENGSRGSVCIKPQ